MKRYLAYPVVAFAIIGCSGKLEKSDKKPVVVSLLGTAFYEPDRSADAQSRLDSNLSVAKKNFDADPSEENYIWYGRRTAYLMHLDEAIAIFTEGLTKYPQSYKLLRHRGHRYISLRRFDDAAVDLSMAESLVEGLPLEVEPDGAPNKLNIPLSTTQFNIYYHLALTYYLKGNFAEAEQVWKKCMAVSENDDSKVAVADWLYMTYRRQSKTTEAADLLAMIPDSLHIIENDSYDTRIKMYKGILTPDQVLQVDSTASDYDLSLATQGYGVGNWYYYNGDTTKAFDVFKKVVSGKEFAAFGFIASEVELNRNARH